MIAAKSKFIPAVIVLSLVLIRLPLLFGQSQVSRAIVLMPFIACAAWALPRRVSGRIGVGSTSLLAIYIATISVALVRGAHNGVVSSQRAALFDAITLVVLAVFAVTIYASVRSEADRKSFSVALALSPVAYVGVNIFLWAARAHLPFALPESSSAAAGQSARLLGLLGVHATRIDFPLALGVNNFGAVAAAGLTASVILFIRLKTLRWVSGLSAAVCLYGILATDSRGALLSALGTLLLFRLAGRIRAAVGVGVAVPLSPVIVLGALSFLTSSGLVTRFSRTGDDLLTGSNRVQIWRATFELLKHPTMEQVFGYGASGQITSGVSYRYAYVFRGLPNPWTYTTHNLALQTILDTGYLGLSILIAVVIATAVRLQRSASYAPTAAILAILIVIVFSGATEALPTYNFFDTLTLTVLILGAGASSVGARVESEAWDGASEVQRIGGAGGLPPSGEEILVRPHF